MQKGQKMPAQPMNPERFAMVTRQAMACAVADDLSARAFLVWCYLRSWIDDPKAGSAATVHQLPSKESMVRETGIPRGALYRAFKELSAAGWIRALSRNDDGRVRYSVTGWGDLVEVQACENDGEGLSGEQDSQIERPSHAWDTPCPTDGTPPVPRMGHKEEHQNNDEELVLSRSAEIRNSGVLEPFDKEAFLADCERRSAEAKRDGAENEIARKKAVSGLLVEPQSQSGPQGFTCELVGALEAAGWPKFSAQDRIRIEGAVLAVADTPWLDDIGWIRGAVIDAQNRIAWVQSKKSRQMRPATALAKCLEEPKAHRWPESRHQARRAAGSAAILAECGAN